VNGNLSTEAGSEISQRLVVKAFRKRLLVFFGVACAAFPLGFIGYIFIYRPMDAGTISSSVLYSNALLLLTPTVFIFGILAVLLIKLPLPALKTVDAVVVLLTLATLAFSGLRLDSHYSLVLIYGALLLWHATAVPCRLAVQAGLALAALSAFILSEWRQPDLIFAALELAFLLAISLAITRAIERSQRSLFEAQSYGNYRILRELGTGGMGRVYAAAHSSLCRPTAIKVMEPKDGQDLDSAIARFEKEVQLSATLTHPNTITIFDYGNSEAGGFFYAMELLDGMDLQRLVERFGPLPAARTIPILTQACGALGEAHEKGIVHRDIKPSNIFLCLQGGMADFVKVLDFGLAKELRGPDAEGLTQTGEMLGTPRYIAPESVGDKETVDRRTDIYLLGAVAYWMLTGKAPFEDASGVDVIVKHMTEKPRKPSEVTELPIPPELEAIVLRCLEKKKEDRFQNVVELAAALRKVPLRETWDQEKAREWWKLHFSPGEPIPAQTPAPEASGLKALCPRRAG
jgi:hypothetical protein